MTTMNNTKNGRPTLSGQIDRLDLILDGLAEALNQSVADAVKKTVGAEVRDAVESAVREVLADPALVRAALAKHAPTAHLASPLGESVQPPRKSLAQALGSTLGWLVALAAPTTQSVKQALGGAWSWCLGKVRAALAPLASLKQNTACALTGARWLLGLAWSNRRNGLIALGVGSAVGLLAYLAGPLVASALCGMGGAAASLAGSALASLGRALADEA